VPLHGQFRACEPRSRSAEAAPQMIAVTRLIGSGGGTPPRPFMVLASPGVSRDRKIVQNITTKSAATVNWSSSVPASYGKG
jgi:hypothetical protein